MSLKTCMQALKQIIILVYFCVVSFSYANANSCSGLKLNDLFAEADLIAQGVIVDAPITESDFLKLMHEYSFKIDNPHKEYVTYKKSHNQYLFDVSRLFKGDFGGKLIEIPMAHNSLVNYKLGNEYIIFARFVDQEKNAQLVVDPCVYVNYTESTVVWDQTINDKVVFGLFITQLFKYSKDGSLSEFFGTADAKSTKVFIKGDSGVLEK